MDAAIAEHKDVIESARAFAENEEDAANYGVYNAMVKTYVDMVHKNQAVRRKNAEAQQKADILYENTTERVLNPMLLDINRSVVAELARLRLEMKQAGAVGDTYDKQFAETTRRLGTLISGAVTPHLDTLKNVCEGKSDKKAAK